MCITRLVPIRHLIFIPVRIGIWEGDQCAQSLLGRREKKSDDWQKTNLSWRRVNVCRSVQRERSNVLTFETERVVREAVLARFV